MNLKNLFQDFNPSKFLVFFCLLLFTLLFSLRLDEVIEWSHWVIFIPLWLWKLVVIAGAVIGTDIWWRNPQYRLEEDNYIQYKAMIICTVLHLLLLVFELLACDKLERDSDYSWLLVFVPLMFASVLSMGVCVWDVKHDRLFELELFCSVNILQFIFLALRLDNFIVWNWVTVLIPLWIVMCLSLIAVLYLIVIAILLVKSPNILPSQRRGNTAQAVGYTFTVIPLLVFQILLADKLDGENNYMFIGVCVPLFVALITLMCMAFGSRGNNQWWFGIRKDFCQWLLGVCPMLQEYGNITYSMHKDSSATDEASATSDDVSQVESLAKKYIVDEQPRVVVAENCIHTPD